MEKAKDQILAWATYGDSVEKIGFIKAFLNCLSVEELRHIKNIATKTASRTVNKAKAWIGPKFNETPLADLTAAVSAVSTPTAVVSRPALAAAAAQTDKICWFKKIPKKKFLALDVEKVALLNMSGVDRIKAATVSVVDFWGNICYSEKVYHRKGSFIVNKHTERVNGFRRDDFINGKPMKTVTNELKELFKDKFIITVAAENDFRSLDIRCSEIQHFDLQEAYRRRYLDEHGNLIQINPLSLRDMFFHHFKKDIQRGCHNADNDAISTMRVFVDGYVLMKAAEGDDLDKFGLSCYFDDTPNLNSMEKNKLFYCERADKFLPSCDCC